MGDALFMKLTLLFLLLTACAHRSPVEELELVSVQSALMHAQASYLKGCVDALKKLKVPVAFHGCRDAAILHHRELEVFMQTDPIGHPLAP